MTDRSAEATPERVRDRAGEEVRAGAGEEATVPVASMDVAPELFPADATGDAAGDATERGAE
ncbi:hypothetical protein SAMN04488067_10958 [Halorubrum xinjiangense]|uniref:Uncharacterized protein n=1 Tax=Halorubrum xinjiangense TaxID=261291 RepID=A0A1G7P6X6_9EURY|nr:hypothetical protein [Halorubrum xinjiangense]SDF81993.1 hypothetical protein SAMN04488067_10958 [Halorubrum xinjiangense]